MPPPRYSPIARARQEFLEEPPAPRFFPANGSPSPFGPQTEIGLSASNALAEDELFSRRDDASTKAAQNAFLRLSTASRARVMPYSEAADIARERFVPQQVAADEELLPYQTDFTRDRLQSDRRLIPAREDLARESALTGAEEARVGRQYIPDEAAFRSDERAYKREGMTSDDPYSEGLRKTHGVRAEDLFAYQQLHETAPPELKGRKRQEWARTQTLGLMKDREAVEAADMLADVDPSAADLIETVTDGSGRLIGQRIKQGADPKKVADMVLGYRRMVRDQALQQRKRTEESGYYDKIIDNTTQRIGKLDARIADPILDAAVKANLEKQLDALYESLDTLNDEWRQLRGKPSLLKKDAPAATPATPAKEKDEPKGAPAGREANVADFFKKVKR